MTMAVLSKRTPRRPSPRALEIFRRHQVFGETQREIARAMDCSAPRVHQVCRYVSRWLAGLPAEPNIPAIRHQHDQTICWLLAETLRAWEQSKRPAKTAKVKTVRGRANSDGAPLPDLVTAEQTEREQCGDPRFLQLACQLLQCLRAMWGADEPKRHEYSGPEGGPITIGTILKMVAENPPPPPEKLEEHPPNVLNMEAILASLEHMPDGSEGQSETQVINEQHADTAEPNPE